MGNGYDWTGEHFESKAVSRSEFEALKRYPDYEELSDGTLTQIEGKRNFASTATTWRDARLA